MGGFCVCLIAADGFVVDAGGVWGLRGLLLPYDGFCDCGLARVLLFWVLGYCIDF